MEATIVDPVVDIEDSKKQYDIECVSFIDPKVVMDPTVENNWVQCRRFDLSKKMGRGDVDYQKWQWNNWDRW